ncbi:hypothetical protein [Clostridium cellulovorans]|uniref:Virulence factor Evf domain-containing protein n=1 Tax=Clostridium cellulovorans (strain ATCC 35296 / DSM 3052 / OCM 3 / 743B) TaxID=573061 RepID=D9SU84_CLOC7|nr:hypothetical protein [Clostridium cellulovorans]ADL52839.1 hypothetical protein Clocel_3152 [Clostridium cellulovorans 743B]
MLNSNTELELILGEKVVFASDEVQNTQSNFQDSDGLISFLNLSSSFINNCNQYKVGRQLCDNVCSFYATLRNKTYRYLTKNPAKVLPGDAYPSTQWDRSVTHYMEEMLVDAGGFSGFKITSETYSNTQNIKSFSVDVFKQIFDAAEIPNSITNDATKFIQGVGQTLKNCWDQTSKNYQLALMAQCHEGVPIDESNFIYIPKVKYYYISINTSQTEFTSDCSKVRQLTFNFNFETYVSMLKASVLEEKNQDYLKFKAFLDKAQQVQYTECNNNLDEILNDTASETSGTSTTSELFKTLNTKLEEYPVCKIKS